MTAVAANHGAGDAAGPFGRLVPIVLTVVGTLLFCGLMILLAFAPELRQPDDGGAHALSRSAVGFAGVAEALRLAGDPVTINRGPLARPSRGGGGRDGLLIVTLTPASGWRDVQALGFDGPVLAIPPKWLTIPDPRHRGWVRKIQLVDVAAMAPGSLLRGVGLRRRAGIAAPTLLGAGPPFAGGVRLPAGPVEAFQTIAPGGWTPVLRDETGATVLAQAPGRPLYLLSDPDLLNTHGVADARTLATALALLRGLRAGDGPFIFDVRLNGLGLGRDVLRLLFAPPLLAVTLCLAAAAVLAGVQAFRRFGPAPRGGRAIALGKAALVDNTAALFHLAGREHRLGGRYAELTAELTARAVGTPRGLVGEPLVAFLDRLGGRRRLPEALSELAIVARMTPTPERMVAAARALFDWRLAMTGSRPSAGAAPSLQPDGTLP